LLVTELPPGTPPRREHFPVRNRIIAGLTLGTVVVEAGERSGSLITARLASEQGREVFAVPGSIFSAGSTGGHRLIQDGAKLIHTIDDLLGEIAALRHLQGGKGRNGGPIELEPALARVFEIIPPDDAIDVDTAAERSGLAAGPLAEALLRLELLGLVRAFPGARYMRGSP
jgi:DNA processing protein